jgi:zinc-binding in reverse transcriptase
MALWIREGSKFTVKSHNMFMQQGPHIKSELHKLWKIGAPPHVIMFSWLLLRNVILTIHNLRKRWWQMPSICSMFYQEEKTFAHLFTKCSFIKQLRIYIHDDVKACTVYSLSFKQGNIFSMIVDTEDIKWRRLQMTTCFVIWRERCARIFHEENKSPLMLVREILLEYKIWFER